jgi:hypothetical protein
VNNLRNLSNKVSFYGLLLSQQAILVVDFVGVFEVQRAHNACDDKRDGNKQ